MKEPKSYTECTGCGSAKGYPITRLCRKCSALRKYNHTPESDEKLRTIYRTAYGRRELSRQLNAFAAEMGWPRQVILKRASALAVVNDLRRFWTPRVIQYVLNNAGVCSPKLIAKQLHRSTTSVVQKMNELKLSRQLTGVYSQTQLAEYMGVNAHTVRKWLRRGLLLPDRERRYTHAAVCRFICRYPEAYTIRSINPRWFRTVLRDLTSVAVAKPVQREVAA